jgi:hypothetical protein
VITKSKKKDRAWFVCPQWEELIRQFYPDEASAARALGVHTRVLTRVRQQTPVARSTLLRLLRRVATLHVIQTPVANLVVNTRTR